MLPATLIPSTTGATKSRTERKAEADMDHDNEVVDIRERIEARRLVRIVRGEIAGDRRGAEEQLCQMSRNPAKPDARPAPFKYRTTAYFPAMTKADAKAFLAARGK